MILGVIGMIKEYFNDLFYEGLGDIFYVKIFKFLDKNIKNSILKKILINIHRVIYLTFIALVAYVMFKLSFPL